MHVVLNVDDRTTEQPNDAAIAREFDSIDKTTGFAKAVSLVVLSRGKDDSLMACGHPVEGWRSLLHEKAGIQHEAELPKPLSQEKIIGLFQAFARSDDSWKQEFQWDLEAGNSSISRAVILLVALLGLVLLIRACLN